MTDVVDAMPRMVAMCAAPNGPHEHVPIDTIREAATCFADCDCSPVVYVRLADVLAALDEAFPGVDLDEWTRAKFGPFQ